MDKNVDIENEDELWLSEYNASLNWDESLFDDLPAIIGHEYARLRYLFDRHKVYASIIEIKDVYETTLKFAVLCAAAEVKDNRVNAKLLTGGISVGTWEEILSELCKINQVNHAFEYETIPASLRKILFSIKELFCSKTIFGNGRTFSYWRNGFLGHGALGFSAGEMYKDSLKKMEQGITAHYQKCRAAYKNIIMSIDDRPLNYQELQDPLASGDGKVKVSIDGKSVEIAAFMLRKEDGIYFYDDYKCRKESAVALNYVNANKFDYHAAYLSDLYCHLQNLISEENANRSMNANFISVKLEEELNRLNAAYHFVEPVYITDWLKDCLFDQIDGEINPKYLRKGVFHLMMERGMGKTSYAFSLDSQNDGHSSVDLRDTVVRVFYCNRVQLRSAQEFADGIYNELSRGIEAHNGEKFPILTYEKSITLSDEQIRTGMSSKSSVNASHMARFLQKFLEIHKGMQNGNRLLLVIDGLDEIPSDCGKIFDFIPTGEMLADDCYLLLTSRNPDTEPLSQNIKDSIKCLHPDSLLSVVRGSKDNRKVLRQYIASMTKNVDEAYRVDVSPQDTDRLIAIADDTFLNLTLYLQLVRSGQTVDTMEKLSNTDLLGLFLDKLKSIYCEKLFNNAIQVLMVILTAKEPLSLHEISVLSGRGEPDLMLLAYLKDLAPLMKCDHITEHRNCNTYFSSNEDYGNYLKEHYQDEYDQMRNRYMNMLLDFGTKNKPTSFDDLPDEISYLGAYLMDYYSEAEFFEKVQDLDLLSSCLENIFYPFILVRGYGTLLFIDFHSVVYLLYRMKKLCSMQTDVYKKLNMVEKANRRLNDFLSISSFISLNTHNEKEYFNDVLLVFSKHSEIIRGTDKKDWGLQDYHTSVHIMKELKDKGVLNDINDLATAYMNRGMAYDDTGKYDEALRDYRECIRIREDLKARDQLYDLNDLAIAYMSRGNVLRNIGRYDEAQKDYEKCIRIRENLYEQGRIYDISDIASAYMNRANIFSKMSRFKDAVQDYMKCIHIMEDLLAKGRLYDTNDLALAYLNRGVTYRATGKYNESLKDYGKCIAIMESLQEKGRLYDENALASAYMNRGVTYDTTGKHEEALKDYGKCIAIRESLHETGRLYDENDLARTYLNRGGTYWSTCKYEESLKDYGICIAIMESLHEAGRLYDENDLAKAYLNRGVTYDTIGKHEEALKDYGKCIAIRESLHEVGRLFDENDLATAYMNRGVTYDNIGRYDEALHDYGKCICIREELQAQGRLYDPNDLATAYMNRGNALSNIEKYDDALRDYQDCIHIMEKLYLNGNLFYTNELASTYMHNSIIYFRMNQYEKAKVDLDKCIEIRTTLFNHGRLYEVGDLAYAMYNKAVLLCAGFDDRIGALKICNEGINLLEAQESLSYYAKNVLDKLYQLIELLSPGSPPFPPSASLNPS